MMGVMKHCMWCLRDSVRAICMWLDSFSQDCYIPFGKYLSEFLVALCKSVCVFVFLGQLCGLLKDPMQWFDLFMEPTQEQGLLLMLLLYITPWPIYTHYPPSYTHTHKHTHTTARTRPHTPLVKYVLTGDVTTGYNIPWWEGIVQAYYMLSL